MTQINAKDVMTLRASTGMGMMDCKKALKETGGDIASAEDWLRKNAKGKMDKRSDRPAGEGRIAVAISDDGHCAAIVELLSETDFTAKNEKFTNMMEKVSNYALTCGAGEVPLDDSITKFVDDVRLTTNENVQYSRGNKIEGDDETSFGVYIHHDGKTGVLVQGQGDVPEKLLRDIAMHVAAIEPRPQGVTHEDIPADIVEKERKDALEQAMESGKPKEIAERIVDGKMRKFFEEVALLDQPFVKDPDKKIKELLPTGSSITAFFRWQIGEAKQ